MQFQPGGFHCLSIVKYILEDNEVGIRIDDDLQRFFLVSVIYGVFLPPNHVQHCSFSLLCLWNPQIQFHQIH